jgi:hypothetical protein
MAKLEKNQYPSGHKAEDFKAFGPPATEDGQFDSCKIAELGCFTQDGKDSNKYYMGMVTQSKINSKWYVYFQWGRTGATNPTFQFVECNTESDAQRTFAAQLHDKNDKRGQWVNIAGIRTLQAKPNKDCYLVRAMATRSIGLPDAKTIKVNEGAKVTTAPTKSKSVSKVDTHTLRLMRDLNVATVSYTRGVMADASIPTQKSIDEARQILQEAQKRLIVVGTNVDHQVADKDLNELTRVMYSRIPKKKALHCGAHEWILNKDNIFSWTNDLDCFESALYVTDIDDTKPDEDVFAGMPITMEWVDPTSAVGKFAYNWWPKATANRHGGLGKMTIKNLWKIRRHGEDENLLKRIDSVKKDLENIVIREKPLLQPSERFDYPDRIKDYKESNTNLLLHGSRSVNIASILRKGLCLPKELVGVTVTGALLGGGIYWASDWKKSAGYTSLRGSYWSGGGGGVSGREAFMLAGDVILGNPHVAARTYGYTAPPKNYHSVLGKGGLTDMGGSKLQNDEWVVYDSKQVCLRYLLEFSA